MLHTVNSTFQLDRNFDAFIATGTVPLRTGVGLPQQTGTFLPFCFSFVLNFSSSVYVCLYIFRINYHRGKSES